MTLDDRRKIIEVLLLSAATWSPELYEVTRELGYSRRIAKLASDEHRSAYYSVPNMDIEYMYAQPTTEAAYRLIESSPTLRREWFGAR